LYPLLNISENGVLTIDEFEVFLKKDNSANHAELREAFDLFDVNGNGYISKDELIQAMKNMGENLGDKEINEMIGKADINKDGQVSFEGEKVSIWLIMRMKNHLLVGLSVDSRKLIDFLTTQSVF
jgi:Ca2+-binding EF-hand superfamily protein